MKFSTAQVAMLRTMDGKGPTAYPANRSRTIKALQVAGMVKYRITYSDASSYYYGRMKQTYHVMLTPKAQDMFYMGVFDK